MEEINESGLYTGTLELDGCIQLLNVMELLDMMFIFMATNESTLVSAVWWTKVTATVKFAMSC